MQTLIIYATRDGQTQKIAETIGQQLLSSQSIELVNLLTLTELDWTNYDRVIIGASIRYGKFAPELLNFVKQHHAALTQRMSGFFSVNLTARKDDKNTPQTNIYTRKFLEESPWQPNRVAVFAGALRYPHYRWFDRAMIRFIMKITGGETDTTKEIEYTDWQQVRAFAQQFIVKNRD